MILLGLQWVLTAFVIMIQPFINELPTFKCKHEDGTIYECNEEKGCSEGWVDLDDSPKSLIVKLELYCDRAYLRSLGEALFFAGGSLGFVFFSHAADKYGRKPALMLSYFCGAVCMLALALYSDNVIVYFALLSICWAGYDPFFAFSLIILNEKGGTSSPKGRIIF